MHMEAGEKGNKCFNYSPYVLHINKQISLSEICTQCQSHLILMDLELALIK